MNHCNTNRALAALLALAIGLTAGICPVFAALDPASHNSETLAASDSALRDFETLAPNGVLSPEAITTEAAILVDSRTGEVFFEKNADEKLYPASTTKIMTCLVALEKGNLSTPVTIGDLPGMTTDSSSIGLKKGDVVTLEELLYGLMLRSGNDAAIAIALHIGGSIEGFADLMNQRAQELGMSNTHYVNPHGLTDENHYTTARDMAILTCYARKLPEFCRIVSTYEYHQTLNKDSEDYKAWKNSNRLISQDPKESYAYAYATGIKTGYTSAATHTLVSSAKKAEVDLTAVLLKTGKDSTTKWVDAITLFEYGFTYLSSVNPADFAQTPAIQIAVTGAQEVDGAAPELSIAVETLTYQPITTRKSDAQRLLSGELPLAVTSDLPAQIEAPVYTGDVLGTLTYTYNGRVVLTQQVTATADIAAAQTSQSAAPVTTDGHSTQSQAPIVPAPSAPGSAWLKGLGIALGILLALVVAMLAIRMVNLRRRARRKRAAGRRAAYQHEGTPTRRRRR